uniref:Uncharacterized protein n=1 Tax=Tetraselmis chuii TaxID=63592 RepID=A0A7S1T0W6_9CHLO|mmetsp:Transcript_38078/g.68308  ORF Transcript_38078/g.68308 Transcript_38078/m.68308 type:complete len:306 (+) Transcript_38078:568-1485(+)
MTGPSRSAAGCHCYRYLWARQSLHLHSALQLPSSAKRMGITNRAVFKQVRALAEEDLWNNMVEGYGVPRASEVVKQEYSKKRRTRGRGRKSVIDKIGDRATCRFCVQATLCKFCKRRSRDMAGPVKADTLSLCLGLKVSAEKLFQTNVSRRGDQSFLATDCCKAELAEKGFCLLEGFKVTTNEDRVVIKSEKDAIDDDRLVTPALETGDVKHAPDTVDKFHVKHEVKKEEVFKECGAEIMQMEGDAWYKIVEPTKKEEGVCDESKPFVPSHPYLGDNHDDPPRRIIVAGLASDEHFPGSCRVFLP